MFDNIGGKIKKIAKVCWPIFTILSVFATFGMAMIFEDFAIGISLIIFVTPLLCLFACIFSWVLYGMGQLIENTDYLVKQKSHKKLKSSIPQIVLSKDKEKNKISEIE